MNALSQSGLNIVVVGGGGIGAAMVNKLLQDYPVARLWWLVRTSPVIEDTRVQLLHMDATQPETIADACAQVAAECDHVHLVVNTVGMLHSSEHRPEKRLKDVNATALADLMAVNAFLVPQLAQGLSGVLRHADSALFVSLSARVGSITDNGMGGWYSYRASKAAHNMLLKNIALEWRVSHRNVTVLAMHPGTVATSLSRPFTPSNYHKRVLTPEECAEALLQVMADRSPKNSGQFFSWEGEQIPW